MFALAEPPHSQYDLHFSIAGIPVRVHPFFWIFAIILGAGGASGGFDILIWVGVLFFSILIHELGHAFTMRRFGESPRIVLYMMGGLAIQDSGHFGMRSGKNRNAFEQIVISAAGPAAGFALAGVVCALLYAAGGSIFFFYVNDLIPIPIARLPMNDVLTTENMYLYSLVQDLLWVNIFWGFINLMPVYPLDGGQIARELFVQKDPWSGLVKSLWLSVIAGAAVGILGWVVMKQPYMGIMFGLLAYSSYVNIQQISGGGGGFGGGGYGGGGPWGGGGRPW